MKKEIWILSVNKKYEVSTFGKIRYLKTGIVLKQQKTNGYPTVTLQCENGRCKKWKVSRLVLSSFDKEMPSTVHCRHLDDNPLNNRLSNLAWGTAKQNMNDRKKNGRYPIGNKAPNVRLKPTDVLRIRSMYRTGKYVQRELADKFKIKQETVSNIILKKIWKHI